MAKRKGSRKTNTTKTKGKKRIGRKIFKFISYSILGFFIFSILITIAYRFINPPLTILMVRRSIEQSFSDKRDFRFKKDWVDLDEISPNMVRAVVSTEDNLFYRHNGFDWKAIERAIDHNKVSKRKRGASTISQQTAKNVFLWPGRDWVRKGLETYYTVLIEFFWSKDRIMEVYLNVIEFGDGIYGIEAASKHYYGKSAKRLNYTEAKKLARLLPSPIKRGKKLSRN
ncbi:MAG: monofunctional biosynthetic peptidoglycan transglycosylase [Bacteroidales bacterium]|jgi:monofunctional biosynthetic peptidoglycan transglycosylase|nr:monofunctional biosynthetic peptidoglycan transglycosylase [Bacteroidales bacterium]MDY0054336.1 monofunctional biosynthetic peptidoglycan transglycosylase [Bacteroidales bacterium]